MNFKRRGLRLVAALTLTGLIASQIPMNSGIALARDAYGGRGNTAGSVAIQVAVAGLVGYGIFATASGGGGGAAAAGGGGAAIIPPVVDTSKSPLWDVMANSEDMKQFADAADKAGIKADLRKVGQYTAFVPTDTVFAGAIGLPGGYVPSNTASGQAPTKTLNAEQKLAMANFLKGHIILGIYTIEQLKTTAIPTGTDGVTYPTLNGGTIKVTCIDNVLKVNDAIVEQTDIQTSNGIIHKINAPVMTTPAAKTTPATT